MDSAFHPSCFDSSIWGKLCRTRKKMGRKENRDQRTGCLAGSRLQPAISRPFRTPTPTPLRASLSATSYAPRLPSPPFNLGVEAGPKPTAHKGRALVRTSVFASSEGSRFGSGQAVTLSVVESVATSAQNAGSSDINRRAFLPIDTIRVHASADPCLSAPLGGRAPGTPRSDLHHRQYSRKVFIGGLPPDVTALSLTDSFSKFGLLDVGWPRKAESLSPSPPKGFAFLQFQEEASVHRLLRTCYRVNGNSSVGYFTHISSLTFEDKEVQVRPWDVRDSEAVYDVDNINDRNSVFVGGVPRPLTASQLANVLRSLFGPVCAVAIETDTELGYPKGSARVTFRHRASKVAAVSARFVQVTVEDIKKRVEVKPFVLQDQPCDRCSGMRVSGEMAQYFCPNVACLQYLCQTCWASVHAAQPAFAFHKPLIQKSSTVERTEKPVFPW